MLRQHHEVGIAREEAETVRGLMAHVPARCPEWRAAAVILGDEAPEQTTTRRWHCPPGDWRRHALRLWALGFGQPDTHILEQLRHEFVAPFVYHSTWGNERRTTAGEDARRTCAAWALGRLCIPGSVAPLAAAAMSDCEAGRVARAVLPACLATLASHHRGAIEAQTLRRLDTLTRAAEQELRRAAISALAAVGDSASLMVLQQTAAGADDLAALATDAAETLAGHLRRDAARDTLLRPAPGQPSDLLRPAQATDGADPDVLVRAHEGEVR